MAIDHSFKIYFVAAQSGCLFITVMQTFLFVKKNSVTDRQGRFSASEKKADSDPSLQRKYGQRSVSRDEDPIFSSDPVQLKNKNRTLIRNEK